MKKLTLILLVLCLVMSMVACGNAEDTKPLDDYEESFDVPTADTDAYVDPNGSEDTEETADAYINAAPANDEQGWGALTPRP